MIILLYMCVSSIHNHTTYMFIIKHITCSDFLALPQCGISQAFAELCTRPTLDSPGELRLWVLLFFYGFPMVRWWFFVGVQWFSIVSLHVFPREMLSFFKCLFYIFAPARPQTWPWWMVTMAMDRASKNVHLSIFPMTWGCTTSWVVTCGDGLGMVFCHDLQLISVSFWCWAFGFHVLYCLDVPGRALRKPSGTELLRPGMGCSPTGHFHRENEWKMTMNQWRLWGLFSNPGELPP